MSRPYPDVQVADPRDVLNMLFAIGPNLLNQANRIGGSADGEPIPLYDQEVGYDDAFRNTGAYPEWFNQVVGLLAGVAEPGPGEAAQVARLLGDLGPALGLLAPLRKTGQRIRGGFTPTAETVGTVPTEEIARLPGFSGENEAIYATGRALDDPRTAELAEHMRQVGPEGISPLEVSVYPEGFHDAPAYIKEGNHRAAAARQLGWEELPVEVTYHGGAEEDATAALLEFIRRMTAGGGGR